MDQEGDGWSWGWDRENGRTCRGWTRKGMAGAGAGIGRMGGHVGDGPGRGQLELGLG